MSKSMWIDAVDSKPAKKHKSNNISDFVLFWVDLVSHPYWGYYDYYYDKWITEDDREYNPIRVKYFAYIDNPYK